MWKRGTIEINGKAYEFLAKVYEIGSELGIEEGRVSKLWVTRDGQPVISYDRGWDIEPADADAKLALQQILAMFA